MGTLTNALMRVLLSWVRGFVSLLWSIAEGGSTGFLSVFGKIWLPLCAGLVVFGLAADWLVWLFHYKPYVLLAARFRRRFARPREDKTNEKNIPAPRPEVFPAEQPEVTPAEEQEIMREASEIPDASLGSYPGMRYQEPDPENTRHYAPADEKAETQRFRTAGLSEKEPEQSDAEREYARKLAEYEQKKAQYDRDMAEYERQMAAYRQAEAPEDADTAPRRRRRGGGE